jgi:PsaD
VPTPAYMAHGSHHRSLQGPNLLKLARKEQCLALLTQLRTKFKLNGQFYRVFPNGEVRSQHASGRCL